MIRSLARFFWLGLFLLGLTSLQAIQLKVKALSGEVSLVKVSEEGEETSAGPVRVGQVVSDELTLVTGKTGSVLLSYDDGTDIDLSPNSRLTVGQQDSVKGFLTLLTGSLLAKVKKLAVTDQFSIVTPIAVAGVRGTIFSVTVADSGATHVGVEEGRVEVSDADEVGEEKSHFVTGGEASSVGLTGKVSPQKGFTLKAFKAEAWVNSQNKEFENNLDVVLAQLESRYLLSSKAMLATQKEFTADLEKMTKLMGALKGLEAQGKTPPVEIKKQQVLLGNKLLLTRLKLKMIGQRLQAFGPVMGKLKVLAAKDPQALVRFQAFSARASQVRGTILKSRLEMIREFEKHEGQKAPDRSPSPSENKSGNSPEGNSRLEERSPKIEERRSSEDRSTSRPPERSTSAPARDKTPERGAGPGRR